MSDYLPANDRPRNYDELMAEKSVVRDLSIEGLLSELTELTELILTKTKERDALCSEINARMSNIQDKYQASNSRFLDMTNGPQPAQFSKYQDFH